MTYQKQEVGKQRGDGNMDQVLVSVIMPAYNCAAYIGQALESALAQDVPLEVIVINDCSKDHLVRIMRV